MTPPFLATGRYRSGQTGRTVNPLAYAFVGSNPTLPTARESRIHQGFSSGAFNTFIMLGSSVAILCALYGILKRQLRTRGEVRKSRFG